MTERAWLEIEMRWRRWAKSLISYTADELSAIFDEKGYFTSTMGEMEDPCLLCEGWAPSSPLKKTFLLLRCDCGVPLLILERMMVQCSPVSLSDLVSFTAPQTVSCKSIKSSERSTGFGCDNDLQKTTNGEKMSRCATYSTPLSSMVTGQSPCSDQTWHT